MEGTNYGVDVLLKQAESLIDMRGALVPQIKKLNKAQYLSWVHVPHHYADAPKHGKLFDNRFVEELSKTAWFTVPLVWVPVAIAFWLPYLKSPLFNPAEALVLAAGGLFIWSFVEYSLHRWVFHVDGRLPDHWAALTLHFLLHGVHHKIPLDRYRLVMPPAMLAPLAALVYAFFRVAIPIESGIITTEAWHGLYGSGLIGYVLYDLSHYAQHHMASKPTSYLGRMKRYHMKHHFADTASELGFGVSTKFWDYVFGTVLPLPDLPSRPTASSSSVSSDDAAKAE